MLHVKYRTYSDHINKEKKNKNKRRYQMPKLTQSQTSVQQEERLKGVKSHLVHSYFTHECYVNSILTGKPRYVRYFTIASRGHVVTTDYKGKLGLSGKQNTIVIQRSTLF